MVGAHPAAPHAVGRRPARLFFLSARRLVGVVSARARVRAHRAHAARVVVQQRAVRTLPLRRRSSGVAVARHGRDDPARPIGFRRGSHETVRAEGRLRAGPRETRAEMSRDAPTSSSPSCELPHALASPTAHFQPPSNASRASVFDQHTNRSAPTPMSDSIASFLRLFAIRFFGGNTETAFRPNFPRQTRHIFYRLFARVRDARGDPSLWRAPLDISATRRFLRVRCRESRQSFARVFAPRTMQMWTQPRGAALGLNRISRSTRARRLPAIRPTEDGARTPRRRPDRPTKKRVNWRLARRCRRGGPRSTPA